MKLTFFTAYQNVLFTCSQSFQVFRESVWVLYDLPNNVYARFAVETKKINSQQVWNGVIYRPGVAWDQDFKCSLRHGRACVRRMP